MQVWIQIFLSWFILLFVFFKIYVAVRAPFWSKQPVMHIYDWPGTHMRPHIIRLIPRQIDQYVRKRETLTRHLGNLPSNEKTKMVSFLKEHYLNEASSQYRPSFLDVWAYFPETTQGLLTVLPKKGMITSRKMHFQSSLDHASPMSSLYYVDYLCVHQDHRNKKHACQLIAAQEYYQSNHTPVKISLFKREEVLTWGVQPVCQYETYTFALKGWKIPLPLPQEYQQHIMIGKTNFSVLTNLLNMHLTQFTLAFFPTNWEALLELIQTENIYVIVRMRPSQTGHSGEGALFFRKTAVYLTNGAQVLSCFASLWSTPLAESDITRSMEWSLFEILRQFSKESFQLLSIENISQNDKVLRALHKQTYITKRPTAYYFYNYIHPKLVSNQVIFIG